MTKWIVLASLFLASPALAIDFTPTGSILTVTYTEPTANTDESLLNDLLRTEIRWRMCPTTPGVPCASAYTVVSVPATALTGGGNISQDVTTPVVPGQEVNVEVYAVAVDQTINVSPESVHVTKRVDRLSPKAPQ